MTLALGASGLIWAGRDLPPPAFKLTSEGLIEPVDYPLWRRASDWLAGRKYIMLTFDDGPYGHGVDAELLSILTRHHAHAVFFEVCANIDAATRDVPNRILSAGSLVGSHTYDHRHLPQLDSVSLHHQIDDCSARLESLTGSRPVLFRPPWGQLSPAAAKAVRDAGMHVVLWDSNSGDTWLKSPQKIVETSLYEASLGGHIMLMHSKPTTGQALDPLLTELQHRGFQFVVPSVGSRQLP